MRNISTFALIFITGTWFLFSCETSSNEYKDKVVDPNVFHYSVKALTDVMIHDIFSPPVASRNYVYPTIAAYEVLINEHPEYLSLAGQLTDLNRAPMPSADKEYFFPLAAMKAYLKVASAMIFSSELIEAHEAKVMEGFKQMGIPSAVFDNSITYGERVADHILAWANTDNYNETRSFPVYTIDNGASKWKPTPPDFMKAIEPHWNKIRPLVIDSATQFVPARPTAFDLTKGSDFYKEIEEVYHTTKDLSQEQTEIAQFWDCNPFASHHKGHAMFASKKITPGGHWIGITGISCKQQSYDLMQTIDAYAKASITIFDAFVSCWDEKYRSLLIRPETVINNMMDKDWEPLLQTPPFPEYTSGHSVVSGSCATMLTSIFGENYAFHDTTEVEFGLTARSFNSFLDAADEAAISRLYGGIHYMPAIENGVDQGKKVGTFVVANLKTRK